MILNGKYVRLRPLVPDDAAMTQEWRTGARAFLLSPGARTVAEQRVWIESRFGIDEYNWVQELADGTPVGMLSLIDIDRLHKRAESAHFLIGEPEKVQGIPVAFEAMRLLYDFAFDHLGLHKVWGMIASDNTEMLRWQTNMGMTHESTIREHYFLNDHWQDAYVLSITSEEYHSRARAKLDAMIWLIGRSR